MKSRLLISTAALAVTAILCQANAESAAPAQSQFHAKGMQLAQEKGGAPGGMSGGGATPPAGGVPENKGGAGHRAAPNKGAQRGMEKGGAERGAAEKGAPEKGERTRDTQRDIKKDEKGAQKTESREREKMTRDQDHDRKASDKNASDKGTNMKEHSSDRAASGKGDAKNVHLDSKQETRVKTVIRSQKVTHIKRTEINFSINVGTRIPTSVHWYPVPVAIVEVVPEYRGYYYIIVDEDILIISPATREIVAVIRLA